MSTPVFPSPLQLPRRALVQSVGTLAAAFGGGIAPTLIAAPATSDSAPEARCALLVLNAELDLIGKHASEVHIDHHFAPTTATALMRVDLDLAIWDEGGTQRQIHAWQAQRHADGRACVASAVRMSFERACRVSLHAALSDSPGSRPRLWSSAIPGGSVLLWVTPRASSGIAPRRDELLFDEASLQLSLVDGSPRDFDAVLLRTV